MTTEKLITTSGIEYWTASPSGETYAVMPKEHLCFGPLRYEDVFMVTEDDKRWDDEDWEWLAANDHERTVAKTCNMLDAELCELLEIHSCGLVEP